MLPGGVHGGVSVARFSALSDALVGLLLCAAPVVNHQPAEQYAPHVSIATSCIIPKYYDETSLCSYVLLGEERPGSTKYNIDWSDGHERATHRSQ